MAVELRDVALPDFGLPAVEPLVPQEEYIARVDAARLPFSNLCGYLPPFLLSPQRAFCVA